MTENPNKGGKATTSERMPHEASVDPIMCMLRRGPDAELWDVPSRSRKTSEGPDDITISNEDRGISISGSCEVE